MREEIYSLTVVSIEDLSNFMKNASNVKKSNFGKEAKDSFDYNGEEIFYGTTAAALILSGNEEVYKKKRGKKKAIAENQLDIFSNDPGFDQKNLECENIFSPFDKIEFNHKNDNLVVVFHDKTGEFGLNEFNLSLPIVDSDKKHVAITIDNIRFRGNIPEDKFDKLCRRIGDIVEKSIDSIKKEGKPTYDVYTASEEDFINIMSDIENEYGNKNFRYLPSVYLESACELKDDGDYSYKRNKYMSFKFSDNLMKNINKTYSDQRDCENPNNMVARNAVDFITSDIYYNNSNEMTSNIIIRKPWMIDNSFSAFMHANFNEFLEGKREINKLDEFIERPDIKKPIRISLEKEQNFLSISF